jgi:molybdopterin synthase catalytic subunit
MLEEAYLTFERIDPAAWHAQAADTRDGAAVEFVGLVRGDDDGLPVTHLVYEAYAPMAAQHLARLIAHAQQRWGLHRVMVRHRLGTVPAGEVAVFIGVQAPHRQEAFAACQFLIEAVKAEVPIWKVATGTPQRQGMLMSAGTHAH